MDALEITARSVLEKLSRGRFGGKTSLRETVLNVGITVTKILSNNPNRVSWQIINEGANDIRVSTSANISGSSGWLLASHGGIISMDWETDGEGVGYQLNGIANVAQTAIRVVEVVRL